MEVVLEPNIVNEGIKMILDDSQWLEHMKDPQLKQIKHNIIQMQSNFLRDL
jgi:hypothetical protein